MHLAVNLWRDLRRDLGHDRAGLGSGRGSFRNDRARFRNASLGSDGFRRGLDDRGRLGALGIGPGSWSLLRRPGGGASLRTGLRRKARGSQRHGYEFRVRTREPWGIPEERAIFGDPSLLQGCFPSKLLGSVPDPWQLSLVLS